MARVGVWFWDCGEGQCLVLTVHKPGVRRTVRGDAVVRVGRGAAIFGRIGWWQRCYFRKLIRIVVSFLDEDYPRLRNSVVIQLIQTSGLGAYQYPVR
jgi:hypothetical protein